MNHEYYMKMALDEAYQGCGSVSPNPMVGAVLVKNDLVLSKGYHCYFGADHAEIMALKEVDFKAEGATLYINLEPCCHFGKTPPCTDAIIKAGIKKVVYGCDDPNPKMSGKSRNLLEAKGIKVESGILQQECGKFNETFFKFIKTGKPFVFLKVAISLDGKIALKNGESRWITSDASRKEVHHLRNRYESILVGINTVLKDDPELTVRLEGEGISLKNPLRIILDSDLRVNPAAKILKTGVEKKTMIFCSGEALKGDRSKELRDLGIFVSGVEKKNNRLDLNEILGELGRINISSLLVEGGEAVFTSFLKEKLADKIKLYISPRIFGNDSMPAFGNLSLTRLSEAIKLENIETGKIGDDLFVEGYF